MRILYREAWRRLLLPAVTILLTLRLSACFQGETPMPAPAFTTMDTLIGLEDMPSGWVIDYGPGKAYDDKVAVDASTVRFLADTHLLGRGASHSVYRYSYLSVAQNRYIEVATLAGSAPEAWKYQSATADESKFVCYDYEGQEPYPLCTWVSRYHEYVVIFNAWLLPDRMTLQDFEQVVRTIDERIARYFSS